MKNLLCTALMILCFSALAQTDSTLYQVKTMDGNTYTGRIVQKEAEFIWLETKNIGTIQIKFNDVKVIERVGGFTPPSDRSQVTFENTGSREETTYFFNSNGYGLEKGEGYYQNYLLFVNHFNIGITKRFSMGFGLVPIGEGIPVWITPKISLPVMEDLINVGLGTFNGLVLGNDPTGFGAYYGTLTVGPRERNLSVGIGQTYENGLVGGLSQTLSGTWKISQNAYLMTENYLLDGISMGAFGGRQLLNKTSLTYGFIYYRDRDITIAFPFAGLMVPFSIRNKVSQ